MDNPELQLVLETIITQAGIDAYNATFNDGLNVVTARQFAAFIWNDATAMFAKVTEQNRIVKANYQNLVNAKQHIESNLPQSPAVEALQVSITAFETAYPTLAPPPEGQ